MKLGTKIAVSHLAFGALAILVIYVLVVMVWVKSYDQLEENMVHDNIRRTQFIWNKERETLKLIVSDWAPWDELYEFARNPRDPKFVKDNLQDSAMANLQINIAVVTDPSGKILFSKAIDREKKEEIPVPASLRHHIAPGRSFLDTLAGDKGVGGVVWMDNQPVLLAAQRIFRSDKTGESPGILVFLRKVDEEFLTDIADIVQAPVHLETGREYRTFIEGNDGHGHETRPDVIKAFLPVKDLYGNEAFALTISMKRTLHAEVQRHLIYFVSLLGILVALIVALALMELNRLVIRRLKKLDIFLKQVDIIDGLPKQLAVEGNDELSQVTVSMNRMLERIAQSQKEIEQLNAALQEELAERKRAEAILQYSSQHDVLTGIYNRTYLDESLQTMMVNGAHGVGVICCDLDGLKLINDTLGHAAGDLMLQRTAQILRAVAPESALVVRTGGDEFLVVLRGVAESDLDLIGHKIRAACEQGDQLELPLQISMGWRYRAYCEPDSTDLDTLMKEADDEMYRQKLSSTQSTRRGVMQTIMKMLEIRDFATEEHSQRLAQMALELSDRIGLPEHRKNDLHLLAQFHDIGKIGVPDQILLKPGALTNDERREMERHSEIGHRIAMVIPELQPVADFILKHHEKWDGTGYPLGLDGKNIPVEDRILAIVDAYDAMTSDRPYRKAMTNEEAVAELRKFQGTQFDPELVETFLVMLAEGYVEASA